MNGKHVQCIVDFAQVYQSKAIKTAIIKAMLVSNYPELDGIANSTLNKWMKNHCGLSYKMFGKETSNCHFAPEHKKGLWSSLCAYWAN